MSKPLIAVVGADGFVGGSLAEALAAKRVVYGPARNGDIHISRAAELLRDAEVVVNAGGFRVRRGLTYADYQQCHQGATAAVVPWIRKGALLVHISSAHVLGASTTEALGNHARPNPQSYPSAAYASAKYENDQFVQQAAAEREFRVQFLRPTILYSTPGDASLVDNLVQWGQRGIALRLYPRAARHHLCHMSILRDVARRVVERNLPHLSALVVADPHTVTSRELEAMISRYSPRRMTSLPVPAPLMSRLLRRTFHSRNPRLDMATWGEIFGVLHLDTVYDPFDTFRALDLDPAQYSLEKTLLPFMEEAFRSS